MQNQLDYQLNILNYVTTRKTHREIHLISRERLLQNPGDVRGRILTPLEGLKGLFRHT